MKRITKFLALVATLCTAVLLAGASASTAAATGELKFGKVGYNANGADSQLNRWKEYIDLSNTTGDSLNVKNWFTQDAWADSANGNEAKPSDCNTAIFTSQALPYLDTDKDNDGAEDGLWLPAGHTIRVYTGGADDSTNDSVHTMAVNKPKCGYNGHYLGNGGDTIYVKKADGSEVAKFSYSFEYGYWVR
jgi:hypothetical protein